MNPTILQKIIKKSHDLIDLPNARHKHFSFIIYKNQILSIGINNSFKSHPEAKKFGYRFNSIHSEFDAVKRFPHSLDELKRCKLVNIRLNKRKQLRLAKPCKICQTFLTLLNFKEIWYSTNVGNGSLSKM